MEQTVVLGILVLMLVAFILGMIVGVSLTRPHIH